MVAISNQLVWEIVKNNNSFMKKVNGRSKRSGTMRFSVEKNNLRSLSSYKHSGIASTQSVGIASKNDAAVLYTKTASKSDSTTAVAETPINKPFAKVAATITKTTADNHYRPDLKSDALAKYSMVYQANRRAKGVKKTVPVKKGRGSD
jgi:large subunit ribosomal protein L28e